LEGGYNFKKNVNKGVCDSGRPHIPGISRDGDRDHRVGGSGSGVPTAGNAEHQLGGHDKRSRELRLQASGTDEIAKRAERELPDQRANVAHQSIKKEKKSWTREKKIAFNKARERERAPQTENEQTK
jgi:hypothetical protein